MASDNWFIKVKLLSVTNTSTNSVFKSTKASLPIGIIKETVNLDYDPNYNIFFDSEDNTEAKLEQVMKSMNIIGAECPKCKKLTFVRVTRQLRGSDEGASVISHCSNQACLHSSTDM